MLTPRHFSYTCARCREDILPGQGYVFVEGNGPRARIRVHHTPDCNNAQAFLITENDLWAGHDFRYVLYTNGFREYAWSKNMTEGRSPKRILLWSSEQSARREYQCDECRIFNPDYRFLETIYPGERYIREVYVGDKGWEVKRSHIQCPTEPWEDPNENKDYDHENLEIEEDDFSEPEIPLKEAA